ncbi:MAG: peptide-methionine (R)-S-oxide reductase MsrB [Armatimonadota bacterium]
MSIATLIVLYSLTALVQTAAGQTSKPSVDVKAPDYIPEVIGKITKTPAEWRKSLTSTQFQILRQAATERAFANSFWNNHADGLYSCAGCDLPLFFASTKFDSGTGWPSFYQPIQKRVLSERRDADGERVEIRCARCDGHLGHLFDDANGQYGIPKTPNGLRYCMNSGAMRFRKRIADQPKP